MAKTKRVKPTAFISGVNQEPKLNPYQKHELAQKAIEKILSGSPRQEILEVIRENMPVQLSKTGIINIYEWAKQWLEENSKQDGKVVQDIHVGQYEEIYQYFESIGNIQGMNKAMRQKETLLGLHRQVTVAKINKTTNINFTKAPEYDMSQLTPEKRARLNELIKKATK